MNNVDHFPLPIPEDDMPPIPSSGEKGPHVCDIIQLYLGILEELPPEQARLVLEHVRICNDCTEAQRQMEQVTWLLAGLPASTPCERVDHAVMDAIAARSNSRVAMVAHNEQPVAVASQGDRKGRPYEGRKGRPYGGRKGRSPRGSGRVIGAVGALVLAAALVLALLATLHFGSGLPTQTFTLPSNLSWNGYVLYHTETRIDTKGERYSVNTYHEMATGRMHVETVMPGSMDVVVVGDDHSMLGLDMMHHVAQWGADAWSVDETPFDLAQLRSDLHSKRAVYLDKDTFRGQPVYRVRARNGLVLLLDMNYRPVNVLSGAVGPGTGEPMYDTLVLMPNSHVSSSMWDMRVPEGFRMGTLPSRP
ncbi:MAG: anti-sigma factor family protein [Ktedonobacteraceae bacterium]